MRICKRCDNEVPKYLWVGKKKHNLQNRKFCLECSPFGERNTRDLSAPDKGNEANLHRRVCISCDREYNSQNRKGAQCYACYFSRKEGKRSDKVYDIVGEACWYCNYNKGVDGRRILNFHHIDPETKCFGLSTRETTALGWDKVLNEMRKCALLCCRCHQEVEYGLIDSAEVEKIYKDKWEEINLVS